MRNIFFLLTISIFLISCGSNEVEIGDQIWMTKNLDVTKFRNGDEIPQAKTDNEFTEAGYDKKPAWCYYRLETKNNSYGKLYNWYAVSDSRGLAPEGWHIPTGEELEQLKTVVESLENGSAAIKSTELWAKEQEWFGEKGSEATNSSGFNALPAGEFSATFTNLSLRCIFWSSTGVKLDFSDIIGKAKVISLSVYNDEVRISEEATDCGYSVRCIKD